MLGRRPGVRARPGAVAAVALLALVSTPAVAQEAGDGSPGELGSVSFPVTCAPEVQAEFDRGVALLHHMMYEEARAVFRAVADADPGCAMARWGVATTLFQPLWPTRPGADALRRGRALLEEARSLGVGSDRERAFLRAAEAFYREPEAAGWWTRIRRWAAAMDRVLRERPDDREARAFWALSQLAVAQVADDPAARREAAARELRAVWEEEPRHPGAVHYTIHANDVAGRAGEDPDIVSSYSAIAPSVPHALHMPTHIYVRTGDWEGVVEWNRRSADAARERPAGDVASHHHAHAADYLVYAHLQRGDHAAARAVLEEMREVAPYQPTFIAAFHQAALPARLAVERRAWTEAAALEPREPAHLDWDRFPWPEGLTWLARGLGAVETGDLSAARDAEARLAELRDRAEAMEEPRFAAYLEVDRRIVAARLAVAEGRGAEAVRLLEEAVALESETPKDPVSPGSLLPPAEALGQTLLELDRPAEALAAYRRALDRWPDRYHSLLGAARAAEAAGEAGEAARYRERLAETTGGETAPAARRR
jgi:tetratricopeptide (TPR) repeat protein